MDDFFQRIRNFVDLHMDICDQLEQIHGYKPTMGHRYAFHGRTLPLSIFQGEGLALYAFVNAFEPRVVLDFFTGTGFAAAHLGAGCSRTRVYSLDNYSEGDAGDVGFQAAQAMIQACELENVKLIRGSHPELMHILDADGVSLNDIDVVFLDGPGKDISKVFVHREMVVITHDEQTHLGPCDFRVMGGSHLTFNVLPEMLPLCYEIFSPYFILGVADNVAWRPDSSVQAVKEWQPSL